MAGSASDYHKGNMPIVEQKSTWHFFMQATWWGALITGMIILAATLHFAVGMSWWVALGAAIVLGIAGGLFLNLGAAWIATVIALAIVGGVVGVLMALAGAKV
jgi:hypothetical protein